MLLKKAQLKNTKPMRPAIKNRIEISPDLKEDTVVFSYSKMNPINYNHVSLIESMQFYGGDKVIHVSKDSNDKLMICQEVFGNIIKDSIGSNIMESLTELAERYHNLILVVGESEVQKYSNILENHDFGFTTAKIISHGSENPDFALCNGYNRREILEAYINDDVQVLMDTVPQSVLEYHDNIYTNVLNESLNVSQRIARGQVMKRNSAKLKSARKMVMARHADSTRLKHRSTKDAITFIKQKIMGGRSLENMSYGDKARVEDMLKTRRGAIKRLSVKLLNKTRQR